MREQVQWFAKQMEAKLINNDFKGGWDDCDLFVLIEKLEDEVAELKSSFFDYLNINAESPDIISEAADVANFSMMIADIARKRLKVK